MKLLITTQAVDKNYPILGFFLGWILEFAKYFDEVHVICLQKGEYDLPENVFVYSLGKEEGESRLKYVYRFYKYFWHIFFKVRVDYVFFHMGAIYNIMVAPFFWLRKLYKTKFYWWKAHGHINRTGRTASWFVEKIFTSTASGYPIDTPKRNIIGQAIDPTLFKLPAIENRSRSLIFVGRATPVKKIEIFLKTVYLLRKKGLSFVVKIIGPTDDKQYLDTLLKICNQYEISHSVFVGSRSQNELVEIYQNSLIFLNTSVTHSMDKTVIESVFCGCIPVTGNRAFAELLGGDGLYIENASAEQYADVIERVVNSEHSAVQKQLYEKAVKQHNLATLSERIFNTTKL